MIGPSAEVVDVQSRTAKRKIFDELDIDSFCEELYQTGRKRYLQELTTPVEFVAANQIITDTNTLPELFSSMSDQEVTDEFPVARLEVLVVDGTNCTWTTMSELENHQSSLTNMTMISSPSSSLSSLSSVCTTSTSQQRSENAPQAELRTIDESCNDYQQSVTAGYWEPVTSVGSLPSAEITHTNATAVVSENNHQQQYEDQENGNLSWLLDFKLDSLIESADDRITTGPRVKDSYYGNKSKVNGRTYGSASYANECRRTYNANNDENPTSLHQAINQNTGYGTCDDRNFASSRCNGPKKPPFTYTELIEHALQERGELTVSAIYQWISEHFPYYKSNDDRWKNSVRHNLSINPHFRKGSKAPHGAGHLWAIANRGECRPGISTTNSVQKQIMKNITESSNYHMTRSLSSQVTPMDEIEAATASITQPPSEDEDNNIVNSVTLEHCAEQILSGVKRDVEVQYLIPMLTPTNGEHDSNQGEQTIQAELDCLDKESDFLNPVSKEVVAEECGLISEGYLVTDLNPTTLGLNIVDQDIITPENLFSEDLSFQFYELTSSSQLQSA